MNMNELSKAQSTDALEWARAFVAQIDIGGPADPYDQGWMIGVFANAIEAGRAAGLKMGWQEGAQWTHHREHGVAAPSYILERNPYGPAFPGTEPDESQAATQRRPKRYMDGRTE